MRWIWGIGVRRCGGTHTTSWNFPDFLCVLFRHAIETQHLHKCTVIFTHTYIWFRPYHRYIYSCQMMRVTPVLEYFLPVLHIPGTTVHCHKCVHPSASAYSLSEFFSCTSTLYSSIHKTIRTIDETCEKECIHQERQTWSHEKVGWHRDRQYRTSLWFQSLGSTPTEYTLVRGTEHHPYVWSCTYSMVTRVGALNPVVPASIFPDLVCHYEFEIFNCLGRSLSKHESGCRFRTSTKSDGFVLAWAFCISSIFSLGGEWEVAQTKGHEKRRRGNGKLDCEVGTTQLKNNLNETVSNVILYDNSRTTLRPWLWVLLHPPTQNTRITE